MKRLTGKTLNISEEILGKVTFKRNHIFSKKDLVCVVQDTSDIPKGYPAVLSNIDVTNTKQAVISEIQGLSELNEGDVVLITP
ncbi:MAG: hypothetical protein LBR17_03070 [Bacteroidales bacterium]|jgi:hypothetical protein|nr:hypothetical protein [Bacteroidales bacterium]